jgi:hypothetical protein
MQSWGFSMNILGNFAEPFMVGSNQSVAMRKPPWLSAFHRLRR